MNRNDITREEAIGRAVRQQYDLRLVRAKDYDRLFAQYLPVIEVTCRMRGLSHGETLEVTSIVCERMWREFEQGKDFSRTSIYGSFVWKARWEAAGARERRAGSAHEEPTEPDIIARLAEAGANDIYPSVLAEEYEELYAAMEHLTERQLLVVELFFLEDLSVSEVAEYMGADPNAISQLKFHALKKLALILGA
jgi:RNA polymerase sigma factor (sigma-70 family)